jgi:hypothetical protein
MTNEEKIALLALAGFGLYTHKMQGRRSYRIKRGLRDRELMIKAGKEFDWVIDMATSLNMYTEHPWENLQWAKLPDLLIHWLLEQPL